MKTKTSLPLICMIVLLAVTASAMTLEQYAESLDFNFFDGTIYVSSVDDQMVDADGDFLNDTLRFTITTDAATPGVYTAVVIIDEVGGSNMSNITVMNPGITVDIDTDLLSGSQWNYSVRLYDGSFITAFRNDNYTTAVHGSYKAGANLISIVDAGSVVGVNLTVNGTDPGLTNVSVVFGYNDSSVTGTTLFNLSQGLQLLTVALSEDQIKSTHHVGTFHIERVAIGDRVFVVNHTTQQYDYESFMTTAYIQGANSSAADIRNNLTGTLLINPVVRVFQTDTYVITGSLYDDFNNKVTNFSRTLMLNPGLHLVPLEVNGTKIYASGIDGPYVVSNLALRSAGVQKDIVGSVHKTAPFVYADFVPPPRADLDVDVFGLFNLVNQSNLTVTITNQGEVPAVGVIVDFYALSLNVSEKEILDFLEVNESVQFNYSVAVNSTDPIFTAFADFPNIIDEGNETNNVVSVRASHGLLCGDCDQSRDVNILDSLIAARYSSGVATLTPAGEVACDVTGDGDVTILDSLTIARFVVGIVPQLTC